MPSVGGSGEGAGAGAGGEECPEAGVPTVSGILDSALDETSGLTASRRNAGVFYAHNDSSSPVYAVTEAGAVIAELELPGALVVDWEDIATGPGPEAGASYLYVGDIGDNDLSRNPSISVQRALEPELDVEDSGASVELEFETLYFRYPDGPRNAEALFVDPATTDLYVLTKHDGGSSELFVARAPYGTSTIATLESVASLEFGAEPLSGSPLVTGAAIAHDGTRLVVRTYDSAFLWELGPAPDIAAALTAPPCPLPLADEAQGEAIAFSADGRSYYTTGEGSGAALSRVALEGR